jgi:hypothetical protein
MAASRCSFGTATSEDPKSPRPAASMARLALPAVGRYALQVISHSPPAAQPMAHPFGLAFVVPCLPRLAPYDTAQPARTGIGRIFWKSPGRQPGSRILLSRAFLADLVEIYERHGKRILEWWPKRTRRLHWDLCGVDPEAHRDRRDAAELPRQRSAFDPGRMARQARHRALNKFNGRKRRKQTRFSAS